MAVITYSDLAQGLTPAATAAAGAPTGTSPAPLPQCAGEVVSVRAKLTVAAAGPAINDVGVMCLLPAECEPVDCTLITDGIDTSTGLTTSVSVLDDTLAAAVASTDFITSSTIGRSSTAGVARASVAAGLELTATLLDRWIGVVFTAAPTTQAAGYVYLIFTYRRGIVAGG